MNAKRRLKKCLILSELRQKSDFDPPLWIEPPFLTHLKKMRLIHVADKNTNAL
jgi:hypothetical protein